MPYDEIDEWANIDFQEAMAHEIGASDGFYDAIFCRRVLFLLLALLTLMKLRCLQILCFLVGGLVRAVRVVGWRIRGKSRSLVLKIRQYSMKLRIKTKTYVVVIQR